MYFQYMFYGCQRNFSIIQINKNKLTWGVGLGQLVTRVAIQEDTYNLIFLVYQELNWQLNPQASLIKLKIKN